VQLLKLLKKQLVVVCFAHSSGATTVWHACCCSIAVTKRRKGGRRVDTTAMENTQEKKPTRIPVISEFRIATAEPCLHCGSRRKTLVASLGWICTGCFDHCKEEAEKLLEVGSGVVHIRQAYELAICSYRESHSVRANL
jgi:hypothetical protein